MIPESEPSCTPSGLSGDVQNCLCRPSTDTEDYANTGNKDSNNDYNDKDFVFCFNICLIICSVILYKQNTK